MSIRATTRRDRRSDWIVMQAVHDAFLRDLDDMIGAARRGRAFRKRWILFRDQLALHHAAEDKALWPAVRAKLNGDPDGLALVAAMEDEHCLLDPLLAAMDEALATDAAAARTGDLLASMRTTLLSHLAHEELDALPMISSLLTRRELAAVNREIRKLGGIRQASVLFPWALSTAAPDTRDQVLRQLPPPARVLYRLVWLPRYTRRFSA